MLSPRCARTVYSGPARGPRHSHLQHRPFGGDRGPREQRLADAVGGGVGEHVSQRNGVTYLTPGVSPSVLTDRQIRLRAREGTWPPRSNTPRPNGGVRRRVRRSRLRAPPTGDGVLRVRAAHARSVGFSSTIRARRPLTKLGDSSVDSWEASSTASATATPSGTSSL